MLQKPLGDQVEASNKDTVYRDALFVTAVCWMKTGPP